MPDTLIQHTETKARTKSEKEAHYKKLEHMHDFYKVSRNKDGEFKGIEFLKPRILKLLTRLNFYRFDLNIDSQRPIKIVDNKIKEVSQEYIKDTLQNYILNLEQFDYDDQITITSKHLYEKWIEWHENIKPAFLNRLKAVERKDLQTDTRTEKYLYFKNCAIRITSQKIETVDYKDITGYIWENQVIGREFVINNERGDYEQFCFNICGRDQSRFKSFRSMIGYILHQYFFRELHAIIFTDSKIGEYGEANGRTGKGLVCDGLGQVLNANHDSRIYIEVDGKTLKEKGKFAFADADASTQVAHINDIYRNATIEFFYNMILKGLDIDKKGQDAFKQYVKIVITTNLTIKIDGESDKARVRFFEFADYYNSEFRPNKEFKRWFFSDDWNLTDWQQFYTFMVLSVQIYLQNDIITPPTITLERRTLVEHTSTYFIEFMDLWEREKMVSDGSYTIDYEFDVKIDKKTLYSIFIAKYADYFQKHPTQHSFTKWLKHYGKSTPGIMSISDLDGTSGNTNSMNWIMLKKSEPKTKNNE